MALETEILTNNYGIPVDFAKNLLGFMHGDLEATIKIVEASEKDIVVIKAKFISNKKILYGALMLFFNFQTRLPEYVFSVISSNMNITKISVESGWQSNFQILLDYITEPQCNIEMSEKVEAQIVTPDNISYLSSFFLDHHNIDLLNLKRFIINELSKIIMDTGIILKMSSEQTNIFHFSSFLKTVQVGHKIQQQIKVDFITLLNIKVEPILAPLGGFGADKLEVYDEILVKVTDDREIVRFIMEYFDLTGLTPGTIYGKIVVNQKSQSALGNLIIIEFAPGIYGRFVLGEKVRIHARKNTQPARPEKKPDSIQTKELSKTINDYPEVPIKIKGDDEDQNMMGEKKMSVYTIILIMAAGLGVILIILLWLLS
jgi:hypothetical protein